MINYMFNKEENRKEKTRYTATCKDVNASISYKASEETRAGVSYRLLVFLVIRVRGSGRMFTDFSCRVTRGACIFSNGAVPTVIGKESLARESRRPTFSSDKAVFIDAWDSREESNCSSDLASSLFSEHAELSDSGSQIGSLPAESTGGASLSEVFSFT